MATKTLEAVDETATNGHSNEFDSVELAASAIGDALAARGLLSIDDIISADDIKTEYVLAWGGRVKVIGLSGDERARVFAAIDAHGKQIRDNDAAQRMYYAFVIAASLVDENNKHIAKLSDAPALTKKNGAELSRVFRVCARLSGLTPEDEAAAVEDLKGALSEDSGGG